MKQVRLQAKCLTVLLLLDGILPQLLLLRHKSPEQEPRSRTTWMNCGLS